MKTDGQVVTLKEAMHYEVLPDGSIKCTLEPRQCIIHDGERGFCGVRQNLKRKLWALTYSKVAVVDIETLYRHHFYHVLPGAYFLTVGTAGCNMNCQYCETASISQATLEAVESEYATPQMLLWMALERGAVGILFAHNEPVVDYEFMIDTFKLAKDFKLRTACHTAAKIFAKPLAELCRHLDAINIDLKAFDEDVYERLCQGSLKTTKEAIATISKLANVFMEVTYLLVPGFNDDLEQIKRMCEWLLKTAGDEVPLHFIRFFPAHKMKDADPTPIELIYERRELAMNMGFKYVYGGNLFGDKSEFTYCAKCKAVVIERSEDGIPTLRMRSGRCEACGNAIPGIWKL
ncbi:MAG: AmmeMemoRadiSam system radical SAM enzyme [Armatimonadota bacterium]|nr:AmmeMemoRadiSam system radical SAM enzyme [Armatimonadota bacterium]MCX7778253.1 AmmeMemoRadiSam system radical SAM enzyme [Armatimonadota bacterium]MDW8025491.1 AmmeMemoRadiSam system radical SAM enzyme [Armatimonadota bacterium]